MEKKLPVGVEDFEKIRREGFYYIDKTGLIRELLQNWGEVNLFTRPRRFGKTLNMSMFKHFFELNGDQTLFDGLEISREAELCDKYMGKFPVISISLKGISADTYETAKDMVRQLIHKETDRLKTSIVPEELSDYQKSILKELLNKDMSDASLMNSLWMLTVLLHQYYRKKVIVLIDEYDVPLSKKRREFYCWRLKQTQIYYTWI